MDRRRTWTDEDLIRHLPEATSWTDLAKRLGLGDSGGYIKRTGRPHADRLGLDYSHLPTGPGAPGVPKSKEHREAISLALGASHRSGSHRAPERAFCDLLEQAGYRYCRQVKPGRSAHRWDFLVGDHLLVEVDGREHRGQRDRDQVFEREAVEAGYDFLRLTNEQVAEDPDECLTLLRIRLE
jgi:very-short-patch-repair endonuclease